MLAHPIAWSRCAEICPLSCQFPGILAPTWCTQLVPRLRAAVCSRHSLHSWTPHTHTNMANCLKQLFMNILCTHLSHHVYESPISQWCSNKLIMSSLQQWNHCLDAIHDQISAHHPPHAYSLLFSQRGTNKLLITSLQQWNHRVNRIYQKIHAHNSYHVCQLLFPQGCTNKLLM